MERFSTEQRVLVIKTHYKYGECVAETIRRLRTIMRREEAPTAGAVRNLVTKFEEHGSVVDKIRVGRP